AHGPWLSGRSSTGALLLSAQDYAIASGESDYLPGPLDHITRVIIFACVNGIGLMMIIPMLAMTCRMVNKFSKKIAKQKHKQRRAKRRRNFSERHSVEHVRFRS
ncbi:MAG: hypothetical protein AAF701_07915, partial [Pseudomonadota bacterium]